MIYNLHNLVSVEIDENSTIFPCFDEELYRFLSEFRGDKHIVLKQSEDFNLTGLSIIGESEDYAFDDFNLFIKLDGGYVKLNRTLTENKIVECEKKIEGGMVYSHVFEPLLRRKLLEKGSSLTHGSCVAKDDKAYVFVAWGHTGKTSIMLHLIRKGYKYLSDDKIILSQDGYVYPYPLVLNLFNYNINTHHWLKKYLMNKNFKRIEFRYKIWLLNRLKNLVKRNIHSTIVRFLIKNISSFIGSSLVFRVDPKVIGAEVEVEKKEICSVFLLMREKDRKKVEIMEISDLERECKRIVSVNDSEDLLKIKIRELVYRFAFPDIEEEVDEVEILKSALRNKKVFRVYLPENGATKEACEVIYDYIENI